MRFVALSAALAVSVVVPAVAKAGDRTRCSDACRERVRLRWARTEMARYRADPMPRCTWWGESGVGKPEWSWSRYRALNTSSGAGGKFQVLPSTWRAVGGRGLPHLASPRAQERVARRVLRVQGLGAWVLC